MEAEKFVKTNLTLNDMYFVRVGNALTTWVGDTIGVVVVGATQNEIPIWGNKSDRPAEIYLCSDKSNIKQIAMELNGIDCSSFYTPAVKEVLLSQKARDLINENK